MKTSHQQALSPQTEPGWPFRKDQQYIAEKPSLFLGLHQCTLGKVPGDKRWKKKEK